MKKIIIFSAIFIVSVFKLSAQTQGIRYQAILIDENNKEIPGIDVQGNYLPNQTLTMRFSITDENEVVDYQEEHQTQTDKYGMINLTIGWGTPTLSSPGTFMDIDWNGTPKNLEVEISLGSGSDGFIEFSVEELTFVPYAYHRNISATGTMIIDGVSDLNSDLNVNNGSATTLTGDLTVDQNTALNGNVSVNNNSTTTLTGDLTVDQNTALNGNLTVNNNSPTNLSGDLTVEGETNLENLNISTLNSVSDEATYVASFENTNNGQGDGIKIKLGKRATKNDPAAISGDLSAREFLGEVSEEDFNTLKGLLDGALSSSDLTYLSALAVPTADDALALASTVCELTESIGNSLVGFLNSNLGLPVTLGPYGVSIAGVGYNVVPKVTLVPKLPKMNLPCGALGDGFMLPNIRFTDIDNPLDNENRFIEFTDNDDFSMGAIKAESIENWSRKYLDPVFIFTLYSTFKGIDKSKIMPRVRVIGLDIAKSYLQVGVQYSSGNGDYAEWLERDDPDEIIEAGDIIGVKGGKITKELTDAEQVMAISYRPIVLGNTPKAGMEYLGNNVAFMGQIPVKIMGPVHSGDFIVGKGEIRGYGVAVHPEDMSLEDYKHAVGRSWDENASNGPKLVNTVVGLHNGNYLNILKQYNERLENSETRLKNLEDKFEQLMNNNSID